MSPQWIKRLADWRIRHKEKLAKALLSEPTQTTIGRLIKPTGVALIMGDRRSGRAFWPSLSWSISMTRRVSRGLSATPR